MKIEETRWGRVVKWGYNCEENVRDLRKLNPNDDARAVPFFEMSDMLNGEIISTITKLDKIVKDNDGRVWDSLTVRKYDILSEYLRVTMDELENLCIHRYPDWARENHYSYCV